MKNDRLFCLQAMQSENLGTAHIQRLKKFDVLDTVEQVRKIFLHPCPQKSSCEMNLWDRYH